jgi:phage-related protein
MPFLVYPHGMRWTVELLDKRVERELDELPVDMRARFRRIVELLQESGVEAARAPHVRPLGRGLYEMRMNGRDGIGRAVYVHAHGPCLVVVLVFVKKTQKTPKDVLELALKRAKEIKQ